MFLILDREGSAGPVHSASKAGRRKPNFEDGNDRQPFQSSQKQDIGTRILSSFFKRCLRKELTLWNVFNTENLKLVCKCIFHLLYTFLINICGFFVLWSFSMLLSFIYCASCLLSPSHCYRRQSFYTLPFV